MGGDTGYYGPSEEASSSSTSNPEPLATFISIFGSGSSTYQGDDVELKGGTSHGSDDAPSSAAPVVGYPANLFSRCSRGGNEQLIGVISTYILGLFMH